MIFSNTSGLFWFLEMTNLCLLSSLHFLDALKYSSVCVPTVGTVGLPLFPIKFLLETAESEPGGRASISPNCIQENISYTLPLNPPKTGIGNKIIAKVHRTHFRQFL